MQPRVGAAGAGAGAGVCAAARPVKGWGQQHACKAQQYRPEKRRMCRSSCWKLAQYQSVWSRRKVFRLRAAESAEAGNGGFAVGEAKAGGYYGWADSSRPRICILGGGFGGLYTALQLECLVWPANKRPQVVVVDQSERFVFKPLLYELLSGEVDVWEMAPRFTDLFSATSIQFVKDTVKVVTPCDDASRDVGGTVLLESGVHIEYDWLLLALGAETKMSFVPGAQQHALAFASLEDALGVDAKLTALERERFGKAAAIQVVIVGSGYSGVELAATVAQRLGKRGRVKVVDTGTSICSSAAAGNREAASRVLAAREVELLLGCCVSRVRSGPVVELVREGGEEGEEMVCDLVLWTVGTKPLLPAAQFPVNGRGQADTDVTLRVRGHPRVFAIGDSAGAVDASGTLLPTTAQVAFQQAEYAGWNLWAAINKRPLRPFNYSHLGEMMTLGKYSGAVTPSFLGGLTLDGVLGHSARKLAYLYRLPTNEHRFKVGLSWFTKTAIDSISFAQDSLATFLSPAHSSSPPHS